MPSTGIQINPECVSAFNDLKMGKKNLTYIIYKISDDEKEIVVDETGTDGTYEEFREKLVSKKDPKVASKTRPSYAVYDLRFNTEDGARTKVTFISYSDDDKTSIKSRMVYATSSDALKKALNGVALVYQANDAEKLEYENLLEQAAKGMKVIK